MTALTTETLPQWFDDILATPPDEESFHRIATEFMMFDNKPQFFLTLYQFNDQQYKKLAETLLLYQQKLTDSDDTDLAIRNAHQHYIVNTNGDIPMKEGEDNFDVFRWAQEYAALFNIELIEQLDETLMIIDDPDDPIVCEEWGAVRGQSSSLSLRQVGQLINYSRYGRADVIPSHLMPFDLTTNDYSKVNSFRLADFSSLAYRQEDYVTQVANNWGFPVVKCLNDDDTDTQGMICANDDVIILCFRGTKSLQDWKTDFTVTMQDFEIIGADDKPVTLGEVHSGFLDAYQSVAPIIEKALLDITQDDSDRPIFVTGHSLGAALAQIAALSLHHQDFNIQAVYTFGSPRVGDKEFCEAYNADDALGHKTYIHMNYNDLITTVPPILFAHAGWHHFRFDNKHHTMRIHNLMELDDVQKAKLLAVDESLEPPKDDPSLFKIFRDVFDNGLEHIRRKDIRQTPDDDDMLGYNTKFSDRVVNLQAQDLSKKFLNGHLISNYLFKLACSIIDDEFDAMEA